MVDNATGVFAPMEVEMIKKCYKSKPDDTIAVVTDYITSLLGQSINTGNFTDNIQSCEGEDSRCMETLVLGGNSKVVQG